MAKSNLKSINNNNVTQTSNPTIFSKSSYSYNLYLFLNFLDFFNVFFFRKNFFFEKYSFFFKNITDNSFYRSMLVANINRKKNFIKNLSIKVFFINGRPTFLFDYIVFKKNSNISKMRVWKKKKIIEEMVHSVLNY